MAAVLNLVSYLGSLIAFAAAAFKVVDGRGIPATTSRKYLISCIISFGLALSASAPDTLRAAAAVEPTPNVGRLVANAIAMFSAFCVLGVLAHSERVGRVGLRMRVLGCALTGCIAGMALLLVAADTRFSDSFTVDYGRNPLILGYLALYLGFMSVSLIAFVLLVRRYTRDDHAHPVIRRGFRLTVSSAHLGLAWVAWKIAGLVSLLSHGDVLPFQATVSQAIAALAIGVGAAGTTFTSWAPTARNLAVRIRIWRARRAIEPLWTLVVDTVPQVRLQFGRSSSTEGDVATPTQLRTLTRVQRAEYELYRQVIEIRDGQFTLRPNIPPQVPVLVAESVHQIGADSVTAEVLLEATELAAGLAAHRKGMRFRSAAAESPAASTPGGALLLAEAAWLARVGHALRSHSMVWGVYQELTIMCQAGELTSEPH